MGKAPPTPEGRRLCPPEGDECTEAFLRAVAFGFWRWHSLRYPASMEHSSVTISRNLGLRCASERQPCHGIFSAGDKRTVLGSEAHHPIGDITRHSCCFLSCQVHTIDSLTDCPKGEIDSGV